jgi:hypothetical protein
MPDDIMFAQGQGNTDVVALSLGQCIADNNADRIHSAVSSEWTRCGAWG